MTGRIFKSAVTVAGCLAVASAMLSVWPYSPEKTLALKLLASPDNAVSVCGEPVLIQPLPERLLALYIAELPSVSSQTVRMLHCTRESSLSRHVKEVRAVTQLRLAFPASDLAKINLNLLYADSAERGLPAAAAKLFGRSPNDLSLSQSALLLALTQGPKRLSPTAHPDRAINARNNLLKHLKDTHAISEQEFGIAMASSLLE